jgi:gliding motility-associated-like protein
MFLIPSLGMLTQAPRPINHQGALRDLNDSRVADRTFSIRSKLGSFKNLLFRLLIPVFFTGSLNAQTKPSHVINSAGGQRASSTIKLTDNVGEPFITTINNSNSKITQGFLQPPTSSKTGFKVSAIFQGLKCIDKEDDAFIALTLTPSAPTQSVLYIWSPATVCPGNNCARIDSLSPGIYSVRVAVSYREKTGTIVRDTIKPPQFVIENATEPCVIKVYSGITANDDGIDDVFQIDNIAEFPDNRVSIYNRWGDMLFDVKGYNDKDPLRSWPPRSSVNKLTAGTYFYVIELGKDRKAVKGWVELIKD